MLRALTPAGGAGLCEVDRIAPPPPGAVWIDLQTPSRDEEAFVEAWAGIAVPTPDEMHAIETSSRLYEEAGAIYMTANLVTGISRGVPESHAVTFILTASQLVTVRYAELPAFDRFAAHAGRVPMVCDSAPMALIVLVDAVVDRLADGLELIGKEVDAISRQAFRRARVTGQQRVSNLALQSLLIRLGAANDAVSRVRDSAVGLSRALGFLAFAVPKAANLGPHIKTQIRDLSALTDHASYLGGTITFLLDAALGLISIEQNAVLKVFSVGAIVFMPPTLIAGIYGMNFKFLPELDWSYGYPFALVLMAASAVLPYLFFRWRGWL